MKKLQTVLITGSLPVKLNIVKTDTLSAILGSEFIKNAILLGFLAVLVVTINIFIRYHRWKISVPMTISVICEVVLVLGMASIIRWNIDLFAIAGIIISIGTGVDHFIIITEDILAKHAVHEELTLAQRIKRAFTIVLGAYLTVVVAMLPLLFAGAGLLKGFALTTILGITFGVFIVRPAFAKTVEILMKE
jgi:preprotein translocase subunit SecD